MKSTRTALTLRYAAALTLIACVLVTGHIIATRQIMITADDARMIDRAGSQRMLSQRIALLSARLSQQTSVATRDDDVEALGSAIRRMQDNHYWLIDGWHERSAEGHANFATRLQPGGLADQVEDYIRAASVYLNGTMIKQGYRATDPAQALAIERIALDTDLLEQLDSVVKDYERESAERIGMLENLQTISLALGLLVLLLEILLIFRPMVERIASSVEALQGANEEMRALSIRIGDELRLPMRAARALITRIDESLRGNRPDEALEASRHMHSAMIRLDGSVAEVIESVDRHKKVVDGFGRSQER